MISKKLSAVATGLATAIFALFISVGLPAAQAETAEAQKPQRMSVIATICFIYDLR